MSEFNLINKKNLAWEEIDWPLVEKRISRMQNRIYRAKLEENREKLHTLQKKLLASLDCKLCAVKRVTMENRGRNTPAVDRTTYASNASKMRLAKSLVLDGISSPIKRVYIEKPGKTEKRPLGIPTIRDRAKQMLVKMVLEPEWEAIFEPNSYGFRPGRSCHDAISSIFASLRGSSRIILDADIKKCFDKINHKKLLNKLNTFSKLENQIKSWLEADIMIGFSDKIEKVSLSTEGTPQGGIISPLLANIALHGMEEHIKNWYANDWYTTLGKDNSVAKRDRKRSIGVIRYADDFIITATDESTITEVKSVINNWLQTNVGLELLEEKTKIVSSNQGFEFLGFHFITIKGNDTYKLHIRPSKQSKQNLLNKIRKIIQENKSVSSHKLITLLSSRIVGWGNYFSISQCSKDFNQLDYQIFGQIRAWVFRRKSKGLTNRTDIKEKYFPSGKTYLFRGEKHQNNWILTGYEQNVNGIKEVFLPKLTWLKSKQHIKVKENASPYNFDHLYWAQRASKYSGFSLRASKLITRQNGCCNICKQYFKPNDVIEVDHIIPRSKGGKDEYNNLQALHIHCHVIKSRTDGSISKLSDKSIDSDEIAIVVED